MFSSAQDSFGSAGGAADYYSKNGKYDTILGVNYEWWDDINTSAQSLASMILNPLFDSPCNYSGTFDIEAHSEGTIVTLASTNTSTSGMSSITLAKLKHVGLVAGPIDGTPLAQNAPAYVSDLAITLAPFYPATILVPQAISDVYPFVGELTPNNPVVLAAQSDAAHYASPTKFICVGGDGGYLGFLATWIDTYLFQSGQANDGVVPV